ncbi:MAG: TRAP transporter substrate-binding protein DctP [Hyphomicrobiaceae bacterium]|nr:TRAP transporter substrate-binding protein DctP [Hyphomicrobiaceae bacterium]
MIQFGRGAAPLAVSTAVVALAFGTTASSAADVLNFNIYGPKRAVTRGIETVVAGLNAAANGKVELKIHYGGALGPAKQAPESIKTGGYEGGQLCVGYYPNKLPLLSVMELPFLLPSDLALNAKVQRAVMGHPAVVKEMAGRWNMKYFAPAFLPAYEFMGNRKIEKAADFKGVKVRISGLNAKALQVFGAVPTMVTPPEGYTALERGTIDSFGFPYSYAFGAYKLYEVSKYSTEGVGLGGFMCFQAISLSAWNKIPEAARKLVPDLQAKATDALIKAYAAADAKWIPVFKKRLEVSQFPEAERAKLAEGAAKIWQEWAKQQDARGRPGSQILAFVKAEVAKVMKR